jgi:rhodanese-related sulfurtransferase
MKIVIRSEKMKKLISIGTLMFMLAAGNAMASNKCVEGEDFCISPENAYQMMTDDANAIIIDVRTPEEIKYLGTPGPNRIGDGAEVLTDRVSAADYLGKSFLKDVNEIVEDLDEVTIITICRSGSRSVSAARDLLNEGYDSVYSIIDGFEGDRNPVTGTGYRDYNGWVVTGLPYKK